MKKIHTLKEYEAKGNMIFARQEYYGELRDLLEDEAERLTLEDLKSYRLPTIYGTREELIGLDPEDFITILEEHDAAYDGYEVDSEAKRVIREFVKTFNEKHADHSYFVDKEEVINLSAEEEAEALEYIKRRVKELQERGY